MFDNNRELALIKPGEVTHLDVSGPCGFQGNRHYSRFVCGDIDRMAKAIMADKNIPSWFWHIVAEHCVILNFLSSSCLIKFEWNIKGERYHFKAPSGDILSSLVNVPEGKRAYPSCPHTIAIHILIAVC